MPVHSRDDRSPRPTPPPDADEADADEAGDDGGRRTDRQEVRGDRAEP
jgi:hypothetical protein